MKATVVRLRTESNELVEIKNALYLVTSLLEKELKELVEEDMPF